MPAISPIVDFAIDAVEHLLIKVSISLLIIDAVNGEIGKASVKAYTQNILVAALACMGKDDAFAAKGPVLVGSTEEFFNVLTCQHRLRCLFAIRRWLGDIREEPEEATQDLRRRSLIEQHEALHRIVARNFHAWKKPKLILRIC